MLLCTLMILAYSLWGPSGWGNTVHLRCFGVLWGVVCFRAGNSGDSQPPLSDSGGVGWHQSYSATTGKTCCWRVEVVEYNSGFDRLCKILALCKCIYYPIYCISSLSFLQVFWCLQKRENTRWLCFSTSRIPSRPVVRVWESECERSTTSVQVWLSKSLLFSCSTVSHSSSTIIIVICISGFKLY